MGYERVSLHVHLYQHTKCVTYKFNYFTCMSFPENWDNEVVSVRYQMQCPSVTKSLFFSNHENLLPNITIDISNNIFVSPYDCTSTKNQCYKNILYSLDRKWYWLKVFQNAVFISSIRYQKISILVSNFWKQYVL